ncbi:MAG: tRNA (adenosine(37)-N6)-threonylcarbamoyltransferase complex ATPase subunit type 1 TsaE [Pseudomonadota bacterium]
MFPDLTVTLDSPEATAAFARRFAPALGPGDLLLLSGEIGAGKSHFARAVISTRLAALGLYEDIPSPSYTLVQTYEAGGLQIWHSDLYRLTDTYEIQELGLLDAFDDALCLVEWPDRLGPLAPKKAARLDFAPGAHPDQRRLRIVVPEGALRSALATAAATVPELAP